MVDFGQGWGRFVSITMMGVFLFGLALLASQHLQHIVGVLPYVLLLACPLMHLFGHGHHHHSRDNHSPNDTSQKSSAQPDLDDQTRLGEHMSRSSTMTGGGRMTYEFDEARGKAVGAHIKFGGTAFGISIFVDEVVAERIPPKRQVWRTVGSPRLLIIGWYEMGFELKPRNGGTELRVWIDYELPSSGVGRSLGRLFSTFYARWCVQQMVSDAVRHFLPPVAAARADRRRRRTIRTGAFSFAHGFDISDAPEKLPIVSLLSR